MNAMTPVVPAVSPQFDSGERSSNVPSKWTRLTQARLAATPVIGKAWTGLNHCVDVAVESGVVALEKCISKTRLGPGDTSALQRQRASAVKSLGIASKVTDVAVLASSIAVFFAPPVSWAALSFGLATMVLRKAQTAIYSLALATHKNNCPPNTPLDVSWCLEAVRLMRGSKIKYLQTNCGLMTATDLSLCALETLQKARNENRLTSEQFKKGLGAVELELRTILAGKANRRDNYAALQLAPIVGDDRVSANYVNKSFGNIGVQIPLNESQRRPDRPRDPTVVQLLTGPSYASQTLRPQLGYSLRNLHWNTKRDPMDWVHVISARKQESVFLTGADRAILKRAGIGATDTASLLQQPLPELFEQAFASLGASDTKKLAANNVEDLSKAGRALLYSAHDYLRRNAAQAGLASALDLSTMTQSHIIEASARVGV